MERFYNSPKFGVIVGGKEYVFCKAENLANMVIQIGENARRWPQWFRVGYITPVFHTTQSEHLTLEGHGSMAYGEM